MARSEYARIVQHANSSLDILDDRAALNQARKQASDKRVSTWTNTLEASRKAKFEARRIKAEKLEAERVKIDEMEARVLQKQRTEAISRAQKLVHEQNDLIKRFRGMQGTSDMLEVNKLQENYRKDREAQDNAREKFFHEQIMATVKREKAAEEKKQSLLAEKQAQVAQTQKEQLNAQLDRNLRRLMQEKKDGEETVALAKLALEKEVQEKKDRLRIARKNRMEMTKANEEAILIKEQQLEKERAEGVQIRKHALEKERVTEKRKKHLKLKHEQKQKQIQTMIDRAVEHLENTKNTEDARLERAVQQREAKEDAALRAKAERRAQERIAIDKSRQHQLERKRKLAEAEKVADRTMAQEWIENHKKLIAKERQKEQLISKRNRNNAAALTKMAVKLQEEKKAEREATKSYYQNVFKTQDQEQDEFDRYVEKEIGKYHKEGKNIKALAHALRKESDLMAAF